MYNTKSKTSRDGAGTQHGPRLLGTIISDLVAQSHEQPYAAVRQRMAEGGVQNLLKWLEANGKEVLPV